MSTVISEQDGVLDAQILTNPDNGQEFIVSLELISPETAQAYLVTSVGNRNEKPMAIDGKYVPDLIAGRWHLNGETVVFDYEGALRDGHNRMKAIVKAGVPMPTFVIRGILPEGVVTIDTGVGRSIGDHLKITGRGAYAQQVGTIAKAYATYLENPGQPVTQSKAIQSNAAIDKVLSDADVAKEVLGAAVFITAQFKPRYGEPRVKTFTGVYGLLYILFSRQDPELAKAFFERVAQGATEEWSLKTGEPEFTFRNRMIRAYQERERMPEFSAAFMLIQAWNYRQKGLKYGKAQSPKGDVLPEIASANPEAYTQALK